MTPNLARQPIIGFPFLRTRIVFQLSIGEKHCSSQIGIAFRACPCLSAPAQNSRNERYIQTSITDRSLRHLTEFVARRFQEGVFTSLVSFSHISQQLKLIAMTSS
jgi:hypothetical protein